MLERAVGVGDEQLPDLFAALVEQDEHSAGSQRRLERPRLLDLAVFRPAGAGFVELLLLDAGQPDTPGCRCRAADVARSKISLGPGLEPPDSG